MSSRIKHCFFLALVSALMSLPWIGTRDFYTRGEPREALVAQQMVASDNWILPRTFDNRVPSKPPFTHWLIGYSATLRSALSGSVVVDEWAARLPAALLSIIFYCVFYLWLYGELGARRAFESTLIVLTSFEWIRGMVSARVDTVLSVLIGLGLISSYRHLRTGAYLWCLIAIILLGCATLTKGPVALALPAVIVGATALCERKGLLDSVVLTARVIAPALAIATIWYLLACDFGGQDFIQRFLYENVLRFTSSTEDRPHDHSVAYLGLMLITGLLPWSLMIIPSMFRTIRQSDRMTRLKHLFANSHPAERFSLFIVVFFFLFFSIPSSKRGVYLMPLFPFAAVLISGVCASWNDRTPSRFWHSVRLSFVWLSVAAPIVISLLIYTGALDALLSSPMQLVLDQLESALSTPRGIAALCMASLIPIFLLRSPLSNQLIPSIALPIMSLSIFFQGPILEGVSRAVSERELAVLVQGLPEEMPLYSFNVEYYGTMFYAGRSVSLRNWRNEREGFVLVRHDDLSSFQLAAGADFSYTVVAETSGSVIKIGNKVAVVRYQRVW